MHSFCHSNSVLLLWLESGHREYLDDWEDSSGTTVFILQKHVLLSTRSQGAILGQFLFEDVSSAPWGVSTVHSPRGFGKWIRIEVLNFSPSFYTCMNAATSEDFIVLSVKHA